MTTHALDWGIRPWQYGGVHGKVIVDARGVSLWQRLRGAWLLVFQGGFQFDQSKVVLDAR